jgi:hypothetical protein
MTDGQWARLTKKTTSPARQRLDVSAIVAAFSGSESTLRHRPPGGRQRVVLLDSSPIGRTAGRGFSLARRGDRVKSVSLRNPHGGCARVATTEDRLPGTDCSRASNPRHWCGVHVRFGGPEPIGRRVGRADDGFGSCRNVAGKLGVSLQLFEAASELAPRRRRHWWKWERGLQCCTDPFAACRKMLLKMNPRMLMIL